MHAKPPLKSYEAYEEFHIFLKMGSEVDENIII
jgi:hypothetical protein